MYQVNRMAQNERYCRVCLYCNTKSVFHFTLFLWYVIENWYGLSHEHYIWKFFSHWSVLCGGDDIESRSSLRNSVIMLQTTLNNLTVSHIDTVHLSLPVLVIILQCEDIWTTEKDWMSSCYLLVSCVLSPLVSLFVLVADLVNVMSLKDVTLDVKGFLIILISWEFSMFQPSMPMHIRGKFS